MQEPGEMLGGSRLGEGWLARSTRRAIDIVLSTVGLLALSVPILMALLAIKIEDRGPVLFRQRRYGRGGHVFTALKLRTMRVDACNTPAGVQDHRVTRVGRVLRSLGLDEAPQLVNILLGKMSFVGPRALSVDELVEGKRYEELPGFADRHAVRPGLTGPAAFFLPKDVHWQTKFAADIQYAQRRRLSEDTFLIAASIVVSLLGRWEDRDSKLAVRRPEWLTEAVGEANAA